MQTIIILLDPAKLENADTGLSYVVPVEIEKATGSKVTDNGFDFLDNDRMGIWLAAENAEEYSPAVIKILKENKFCDNDLSLTAEIYISEKDCDELENCRKVYPV